MSTGDQGNQVVASFRVVLLLWLVATGLNLAMPFHIDDTAHLLIAEWIIQDPLHPMQGMINWLDVKEPIFQTNQPHFFFYLMAGVMALFGPSELALHLLLSVFTFAAIWWTNALMRRFVPDVALVVTTALVLSPGFLINQNIMVDMPLLAMMAGAAFFLTRKPEKPSDPAVGFGLFSLALLTKYTALLLFPALIWASFRNRRYLVWALLPLIALLGWSLFNITDVGQAHVLNRPGNGRGLMPSPKLTLALAGAMGAFALPVAALLVLCSRWQWALVWGVSFAGLSVGGLYAENWQSGGMVVLNAVLVSASVVIGVAAGLRILQMARGALAQRHDPVQWYRANVAEATLVIWLISGTLFLVTFPPFMATRHALLLVVPLFILALREKQLRLPGRAAAGAVLGLWAVFAVFIFVNDLQFARFYRDMAPRAAAMAGPGAYTHGHWGWQWYAARAGLAEYDSKATRLKPGEILVSPVDISAQSVAGIEDYEVIGRLFEPGSVFTLLDTHEFYAAGATALPLLKRNPGRTILILRKK